MHIIEIKSEAHLLDLIQSSHSRPLWVFKHSTRCPTSAKAFQDFQAYARELPEDAPASLALVLVIEQRPLSEAITRLVGIQHASPQVILIKEGRAIWSESHWMIDKKALEQARSAHA